MRIAAGTLLAFALSLTPSEAFARTAKEKSQSRDSYVLSRGHSMSANGSIEELEVLRKLYAGDFLWARRSGAAYVIRDPRLLEEAAGLFDGLRALEPEQAALERRQEQLGREEERLDLEQEWLEIDSDRLSDDEAEVSAGVGPYPAIEEQQRDIEARQGELEARQRELDAIEQDLDRRGEELEQQAEAALWKLIDRSIRDGSAAAVPR